ncbi:MAG: serine hydrolase domain-containing protein [Cyclobacteriaceae bacterium]|jgi:D-alanyl-D-alanine carboxypeptidase|nr:beta-lactamase family protein [Flammeovirgaceae bacterium]
MNMKRRGVLLTWAFCSLAIVGQSQQLNVAKLDSLFASLSSNQQAMGSVAISKNGKLLYVKAIGYSEKEAVPPVMSSVKTKYRIGSITKTFTTVLVFQLIEEGKLSLSTPLSKYFPTVPNASKITISQLLNHRSGIFNITNDPAYLTWMTQPKSKDEMVALISKTTPVFEPDTKVEYSNSNFILLGFIIENLRKKPYAQVLQERIVQKIKLTDTYYGKPAASKDNESFSYHWEGEDWKKEPQTDMSIPHGAGAIVSTPTDLVRFMEALFSNQLVSAASVLKMKTIVDGFGMGLFQIPFGSKRAFGHNGGIDGFTSNAAIFPEDSLAFAYCSNGQRYPMNDILIGVLSICFNKPYKVPQFNEAVYKIIPEELDQYLGVYASQQLPLKITITKQGNGLMAQATGQPSFPLTPKEKDAFKFDRAGVVLEFNPAKQEMTLKQGGGVFLFTKEK